MDKAQAVFEKLSFITAHPWDAGKKKDYKSVGNYAREYGNRITLHIVGGGLGAAGGAAIGGLVGLALKNPKAGAAAGAIAGGVTGTYSADYQSIRRSEKEQGIKPAKRTHVGRYVGRMVGSSVGGAVVPLVGGLAGDYVVSREMQEKKSSFDKEAQAKLLAGLGSKLLKGIKGYGKNIAKDWKTVGYGMKNVEKARKLKGAGKMTKAVTKKYDKLTEVATNQLYRGGMGLGKRVGLPVLGAGVLMNS